MQNVEHEDFVYRLMAGAMQDGDSPDSHRIQAAEHIRVLLGKVRALEAKLACCPASCPSSELDRRWQEFVQLFDEERRKRQALEAERDRLRAERDEARRLAVVLWENEPCETQSTDSYRLYKLAEPKVQEWAEAADRKALEK